MEIIPAIDIIDGACVRLTQGDYGRKKIYGQDPVETAKMYEDAGCRRLHLVDLDGAKAGHVVNYKVLEHIAESTSLVIDVGGGIHSDKDIELVFNVGASMVTGGSIAVKAPDRFLQWLEAYGADSIILGADARNGRIAVSGWTEESDLEVTQFIISFLARGVRKVISTDISVDGMMTGPSVELYRSIMEQAEESGYALELIASGGVSKEEDLEILQQAGVSGVIIGKALYEKTIPIERLKYWIR